MRDADTVLGIIRERGRKGLPLEDVYRQLYNPLLYLRAYAKIYKNDGAMTKGATADTVDGMSLRKIEDLIDDLKHERYYFTPVRRTYILKKNGKKRPLGLPTWTDKLLQEVMRSILEAYYEPQFSRYSHGFRPQKGCHTALQEVVATWTGTKWYVEGDISDCFGSLDHEVMLSILKEKIHDNRFLELVRRLLKAGYLEDWKYHETLSGCPQGGIISPILSNIYLDKLDKFMETEVIPAYTRGESRRENDQYNALSMRAYRRRKAGKHKEAKLLRKLIQTMPTVDPYDPNYRRLNYVRYADDWLLGFAGPKAEAEEIKTKISEYLKSLRLTLSEEKTLITNANAEAAKFLGYEVVTQKADDQHDQRGRRSLNGVMGLRMPLEVLNQKCAKYQKNGKPAAQPQMIQSDDFTIIADFQAQYRGVVEYYTMARNIGWLDKLHWVMQNALLKTLAAKHKTKSRAMYRKYRATVTTPEGTFRCLEKQIHRDGKKPLIARFGAIPLRYQRLAVINDQPTQVFNGRNELVKRLLAQKCELCESTKAIQVHHIRKLADLKTKDRREKPPWVKRMAERRRKTLVVCQKCHNAIHKGTIQFPKGDAKRRVSLESRMR